MFTEDTLAWESLADSGFLAGRLLDVERHHLPEQAESKLYEVPYSPPIILGVPLTVVRPFVLPGLFEAAAQYANMPQDDSAVYGEAEQQIPPAGNDGLELMETHNVHAEVEQPQVTPQHFGEFEVIPAQRIIHTERHRYVFEYVLVAGFTVSVLIGLGCITLRVWKRKRQKNALE